MIAENRICIITGAAWRKRRRQLLEGGGDIRKLVRADGMARLGRMTEEELDHLLQAHENHKHKRECLKYDDKRCLSRVKLPGGRKIIVKEYRRTRTWLRFSPDALGWLGSWRLHGTAQCLGWYRNSSEKTGFLFFADVGEHDLTFRRRQCVVEKVSNAFYQAGLICGNLHRLHVFHNDLKPSNFVVDEDGKVTLIDCDDVRILWRLPERLMLRNVAQVLGGIYHLAPCKLNMVAWKAFLQGYFLQMPGMRQTIDKKLNKIMQIALLLYPARNEINATFFQELVNERSDRSQ
ncbi:MAG: hypothetical protein GX574_13485 [Lentisphaerae bacterium]|nr:hypothetical protein [Lentisphaerota bacterium]OQC12566.1 MAG: hypothetical protein BWX73_02857 [Lentisphaerae bacterium ADurb.Bin082]